MSYVADDYDHIYKALKALEDKTPPKSCGACHGLGWIGDVTIYPVASLNWRVCKACDNPHGAARPE